VHSLRRPEPAGRRGRFRSGQAALMVYALLLLGAALAWAARRSQRLAERWRVGADSERAVQLALTALVDSGWVVRNGLRWPGGGDIDHLVSSPDGLGFAIETKTRSFGEAHLRRTAATARWAARRRRRYPSGVVPVLCVVRACRVEASYGDVVVVSLDRLLAVLERATVDASHLKRWDGRQRGRRSSAVSNPPVTTQSAPK
jgi:Nuclease-related domain